MCKTFVVMVSEADRDNFYKVDTGEYQCVVLLLILVIGYPVEVENLFREIKQAKTPTNLLEVIRNGKVLPVHQKNYDTLLSALEKHPYYSQVDLEPFQLWLTRISRFSFRPIKL